MRRLTLKKLPSDSKALAGSTPTCLAAAKAAKALLILCSPVSVQLTSPRYSPFK